MNNSKRKILVITGYRSCWIKLISVVRQIHKEPMLQLYIMALGTHMLGDHGDTIKEIEKEFKIDYKLYTNVEGSNPETMSKSVGLAMMEISSILPILNPDIVLLVGDRYEIMASALTSALNNIPVAHIQGGERSGTIDESLRHSITKLSHIHFPSTQMSAKNIIAMGENSDNVFNVGCTAIDEIKKIEIKDREIKEKYVLLIQHPNTIEHKNSYNQIMDSLHAIKELGLKCVVIYPNSDAGSSEIVKAIRRFIRDNGNIIINSYKNLSLDRYMNLLYNCSILVGNSSSGIRESHLYGIPTVNIGTRQNGRERTKNIIDVGYNKEEIKQAIMNNNGKRIFDSNNIYGDGTASVKITKILSEINLDGILNKKLNYGA